MTTITVKGLLDLIYFLDFIHFQKHHSMSASSNCPACFYRGVVRDRRQVNSGRFVMWICILVSFKSVCIVLQTTAVRYFNTKVARTLAPAQRVQYGNMLQLWFDVYNIAGMGGLCLLSKYSPSYNIHLMLFFYFIQSHLCRIQDGAMVCARISRTCEEVL